MSDSNALKFIYCYLQTNSYNGKLWILSCKPVALKMIILSSDQLSVEWVSILLLS